jgi:hypothetical protein
MGSLTNNGYTINGGFALVPANGDAQHFIFFNKGRCSTRIGAPTGLAMNGTFAVRMGSDQWYLPMSFSDLTLQRQ